MNLNLLENLNITGHLTISKLHRTGEEEVVFDDKNVIVSGMGVALSHLFSLSGSQSILDYQIDRFQVGVNGSPANQIPSTVKLTDPLVSYAEYGLNSDVITVSAHRIENNAIVTTANIYGIIPEQNITRIDDSTVRYTIVLDDEAANSLVRSSLPVSLSEIGLYIKNIKAAAPEAPILVAYRAFNPIRKTSEFSLIFRWSVNF